MLAILLGYLLRTEDRRMKYGLDAPNKRS